VHYLAPLCWWRLFSHVRGAARRAQHDGGESRRGRAVLLPVGAATDWRSSWRDGRATNKYRCWARCARSRRCDYEIPLILSSVAVIIIAGTLSTVKICRTAGALFPTASPLVCVHTVGWRVHPFMIAATARQRSPFDLPEGESEIISGYFTSTRVQVALFFLAEYLEMFAVSGWGSRCFWRMVVAGEFPGGIPSWLWFFGKLLALLFAFIWVRVRLPRCAWISSLKLRVENSCCR